jgi:ribonucleoside-diphosphate reductase alpha chain
MTSKTTRSNPSRTRPAKAGLRIERRYTSSDDPFAKFSFTNRSSRIANPDGSVVFELNDVEVPDTWDQVAVDILASKYFRKAGVPVLDSAGAPVLDGAGNPVLGPEHSVKQVALRLANAWRLWGERGGYFASADDAEAFRDEMAYMIVAQMGAPNSPQWFNTGLFEAYGIVTDPDGSWYFDEASGEVRQSAHRYERSAASACYISRVDDRLVGPGSIFDFAEREARLFSQGSGSGANFSTIRANGEKLSGGGTSSGVMSFLKFLDRAAGAIKSGGTTRRAAKMVILDADHPEIEDFIWCKVREEDKVAALRDAGYDISYEGEAYQTVAFQNGNHSVRLPRGFMDAVRADADWALTNRTDGAVRTTITARDLWRQIADAAWRCADPGVQFDDTLNDWNTAADTEAVRGTNPCSEYTHLDDTACNLASLNLCRFFDDATQSFDVDGFSHAVRLWTLTLEITVSMAHYPDETIAERSYQHRTLGLGYANMGALLMRAGLAYDSDEARAVIGAVTALLHNLSYATSAEVAGAVGACAAFAPNRTSVLRVLHNHRRAAYGSLAERRDVPGYESLTVEPHGIDHLTLAHTPFAPLSEPVLAAADAAVAGAEAHGVRNMQTTVLAPTGTIGLVMSCDTTGIEPDFALVKLKKLAGGGYMQIVNASVAPALRSLGYDEATTAKLIDWLLGSKTLDGPTAVNAQALLDAGFLPEEVAAARTAVASVSDLTWAFGSWTVGEAVYQRLGVSTTEAGGALLEAAGFTSEEVVASSEAICGHLTLEGAPWLRSEHVSVFDCAVECGNGTRVIHWAGHVKALGAASPHLSGAISKTINMPNSVSVDEVQEAYEMSYAYGVKAAALYRDGCKLSQPLNSAKSSSADAAGDGLESVTVVRAPLPGESPSEFYDGNTPPRFRLPNLRYGPTWRIEVAGEELYVRAGEYPDGTLGELFVDWGKQGSTLRGITSALSITISQALQHGVPLTRIVKALKGHTFEPRGVVSGHDNVKMATSVVDAIVRVLGYYYLNDEDLVQVKGGPTRRSQPAASASSAASERPVEDRAFGADDLVEAVVKAAGGERLYGESCSTCGGSNLIRAGSCKVCGDCGSTTGCS